MRKMLKRNYQDLTSVDSVSMFNGRSVPGNSTSQEEVGAAGCPVTAATGVEAVAAAVIGVEEAASLKEEGSLSKQPPSLPS